MKKIILIVLLFLVNCISYIYADFSGFLLQINDYDFDVNKFAKLQQVPRYDVVRLLNYADCQDCTMPGYGAINKYTRDWFTNLKKQPGNYFDDVKTGKTLHNNQDIYYCLSYVADMDYMNGYTLTSPICNKQFCGSRNITYAELIEVMSNIISTKYTGKYSTNRKNIQTRLLGVKKSNSIIYQNFHIEDLTNITSGSKIGKSTLIRNNSQMKTYIKYCTYQPDKCGFGEFTYAKAGQRPIADLNLLVKEGILTKNEANSVNINLYPDGQSILNYIYRLNQKSSCNFNNDYDGDGINNRKDKDPFLDTNYTGAIYTGSTIIKTSETIGALQIKSIPIFCLVGENSIIVPFWSGNLDKLSRNINNEYNIDNQTSNVIYKCQTVGQKIFTAKSYYNGNWIGISQANIYVLKNPNDNKSRYASNLLADKLVAKVGETINFSTTAQGFDVKDVNLVERFMSETNFSNNNINIPYSYKSTGKKIVIQNIILTNGYKLQNAVTIYIYDPIKSIDNNNLPVVNPKCQNSKNCPEYTKFDSLKFGDKVRAILQPRDRNENYVYTDRKTINKL